MRLTCEAPFQLLRPVRIPPLLLPALATSGALATVLAQKDGPTAHRTGHGAGPVPWGQSH